MEFKKKVELTAIAFAIVSVVALVGGITGVTPMWMFSISCIPTGGFIGTAIGINVFSRHQTPYVPFEDSLLQATPKITLDTLDTFCAHCGKTFVSMTKHTGFDTKTGAKAFSHVRGCPDSNYGTNEDYPYCGKKPVGTYDASLHTHPYGEMTTECAACIDQMVTDNVLLPAQAQKLYKAIGARVPEPIPTQYRSSSLRGLYSAAGITPSPGLFVPSPSRKTKP